MNFDRNDKRTINDCLTGKAFCDIYYMRLDFFEYGSYLYTKTAKLCAREQIIWMKYAKVSRFIYNEHF